MSDIFDFTGEESYIADDEMIGAVELFYSNDDFNGVHMSFLRFEENGKKTTDHYVTVTGIYRDDVVNQLFLRVSSWGHEFYIDYHNYVDYVGSYSNYWFSNILYIR